MAEQQPVVSHTHVKINGQNLEERLTANLLEVTVDQHVHLPSMFVIRLYDSGLRLLDNGPFNLTDMVEISSKTADNKRVKLIHGQITALEPHFGEGMIAELTVRGYDPSHDLYRERRSKTYLNVKDSDLAREIARKAKLTPQVDTTTTVYDHLYQHNQSDLGFLRQRAWRIGYECFVADGTLYFRKPVQETAQTTIVWGEDLLTFRPRLTLAEQVEEVHVKSWDAQKKEPIVGNAKAGNLYPQVPEENGKKWAQKLNPSGRMVVVDQPMISQAEADIVAAARLDELSGSFIEADGVAFRRPDIQAGRMIKIEGLGKRLSGNYLVTRAVHTYTDAGLHTHFTVSGARTGLLSEQLRHDPWPRQQWAGLAPAIVTNADDPNGWGRVKVKFPWMADDAESNWARVIGTGAGPDCGLGVVPAVHDEVMVAFQHGDFNAPVVLGGVWNGEDAMPAQVSAAVDGEKPLVRSWTSRSGHRITVYDNADNKVEIITQGGHELTLHDADRKITLKSSGGHEITLEDGSRSVRIQSGGPLEVSAEGELTVKAGANLNLEASAQVNVRAPLINLG